MKTNASTIRFKLIISLFSSVLMAGGCMLLLCIAMIFASTSRPFAIYFNQHIWEFALLFFTIFLILVIVFFLFLIRNQIQYLDEITKTLDQVSEGNLDIHIPVKSNDELGKMAETVNNMAFKLKSAILEERRLEKTKNDLITNISHDLRTPLTSTLGYLDLINKMDLDDKEKLKKYSSIAYNQCKDLKTLVDDLFGYTKLNSSEVTINHSQINIGELLEQVVIGFIPEFKAANMEYRLFFANEKMIVYGDPLLLTRVFDNLITNGIKYGSEGKYLDIKLEKDREKDEAVISVINYGKTISDSDLPYIFERFYRGDKSRSGQKSGSGLGLAIAKSIVDLHKGTIGASSVDNQTVFEVRLKMNSSIHQ